MWVFISFLIEPALGVASWLLSARFPGATRRFVCGAVVVAAVLWGALMATGLMLLGGETSRSVHNWLAHILVLVVWYTVSLSAGVVLQQGLRLRPWRSLACVLGTLLTCGFCILSALTGHLAPADPERHPDTALRFKVLHLVVLPSMTGILLGLWLVSLRRTAPVSANEPGELPA